MKSLVKVWVAFFVCWMAVILYIDGALLCAAWLWKSPAEIAQRQSALEQDIARAKIELADREAQSSDRALIGRLQFEITLNEFELRSLRDGTAGHACTASWSAESVQRTGGWSANWRTRWNVITLMLGPPVALLLAGLSVWGLIRRFPTSIAAWLAQERRYLVYIAVAVAVVLVYGAVLAHLHINEGGDDFWKSVGLYFGPVLVTFGWVFTNEINIRNSRKQHTITLILQYFTNPQRISDKDSLHKALPAGTTIADIQDLEGENRALLLTVIRELNYFDFLASAILRREIDEGLMRRVFEDIVVRHAIQLWPYIRRSQDSGTKNTWADFVALYYRWKRPVDAELS